LEDYREVFKHVQRPAKDCQTKRSRVAGEVMGRLARLPAEKALDPGAIQVEKQVRHALNVESNLPF
jgi:hypothetical protein